MLAARPETLINKRDEFLNKCRHANKFKLRNFKYEGHVDLLYHTANPLIQNEPAANMVVRNLSKPKRNVGTSNLNQEVTTHHKSDPSTISRHTVCVHTDNILTSARARTLGKKLAMILGRWKRNEQRSILYLHTDLGLQNQSY